MALLASALVSACAAPAFVSPVEVTRFAAPAAGDARLGQGTISLRQAAGVDAGDLVDHAIYARAVADELTRLGYRVVPDMGAQVATIGMAQTTYQPGAERSPVRVGGNAGVGSYGSGVGLGVGIDLNSLAGRPQARTERRLTVSIRPADAPANLWEGRAVFTASADSAYATDQAAATRAAAALFAGFPGQSGETIEVE